MKGVELDFGVVSKLLIALLGLVTSTFIFVAKSYSSRANKFLGLFILIMSWFQMQPVLYGNWELHLRFPSIYGFDIIFLLALPALIILYFKYVTQESYRWQNEDFLLLVPSSLQFFNWLNYSMLSRETKLEFVKGILIRPDYASTKTYLQGTIYLYFIFLLIWIVFSLVKSRKILAAFLKENPNQHWDGEHYRVMQRWLKGIFLLYAVMSAMFVFNYTRQVILDVSYDGPFLFFIPWLRMSILVVFVLRILLFPEVLFGVPTFSRIKFQNDSGPVDEERAKMESKSKAISPTVPDPNTLIEQSGNLELTNIQVADYLKRVFKHVQEFQPQTFEDFTLEKLCKQVNIPKSHFSYLLKYHFKETFVEYRTRLRIELACQLLKNSENRLLTLEAIGENVGFSSRFTFIRAFKKVKGITPREFTQRYLHIS